MRELKGETTVFYSTHILDDVQRVSDHVAILDHGRLVKAAPTQVLLGSFTKDMLRVVLGGATATTEAALAAARRRRHRRRRLSRRRGQDLRRHDPGRRLGRRPALHHRVRRRGGPDPHQQLGGDARSRDRLPATHRPEGGGGMTAQTVAIGPPPSAPPPGRHVPRLRDPLRKELTEWLRGPARARHRRRRRSRRVFTTLIPFIVRRNRRRGGRPFRWIRPPTSCSAGAASTVGHHRRARRDGPALRRTRPGDAAWSLTNPVSPTSIIAAKWAGGDPRLRDARR